MQLKNLIFFAVFISLAILQINSITLISKYQTQAAKINEIISNLDKTEKNWSYNNFFISDQNKTIDTEHSIEKLSLNNITYITSFLSSSDLQGRFILKENNVNNTLEITPSHNATSVYDLTLGFLYTYSLDFKNGTDNTSSGRGQIFLKCNSFNYTIVFAHPDYEVLNLVDVKLSYFENQLDVANERVSQMLINKLQEGLQEDISQMITKEIRDSVDAFEIQKENEKNFVLTRREPKKAFNISYRDSLSYEFHVIGVINFMEGAIEGEKILVEEDTRIEPFKSFDFEMQTDQLFIHKKILINLFKLGYEKTLTTVTNQSVKGLKIEGLSFMDLQWLSKFYPKVIDFKPIDSEFYIEYYVNSVDYSNSNALVNYSVFFIAEDEEVLLKLNVSYNVIFELIDEVDRVTGKRKLNFEIENENNFVLTDFKVVSPTGTKLDKNGMTLFVNKLIAANFKNRNYVLLDNWESFGKLIEKFNTIKPLNDGFILYMEPANMKLQHMKFLDF